MRRRDQELWESFWSALALLLLFLCLVFSFAAFGQVGWPTPTPTRARPTATKTPTPALATPTPTFAWPTPTPPPVTPTPTRAVPGLTPTPPPATLSIEVCGWVGLSKLTLAGATPTAATWQRNKAMPVPIYPGKAGLWVDATGAPVRSTLGDNVTVCAGTSCASFTIPTPKLN